MFSHLTDFSRNRNAVGAVGFYIAYAAFVVVAGLLLSMLVSVFMPQYPFHELGVAAKGFAVLVCLTLSLLILQSKNLNTNVPLLLLSLCSAILAASTGVLFGLIIPAAFTLAKYPSARSTHKKKSRKR
jgi:hypothetical protein